jgi:hypothetical protein
VGEDALLRTLDEVEEEGLVEIGVWTEEKTFEEWEGRDDGEGGGRDDVPVKDVEVSEVWLIEWEEGIVEFGRVRVGDVARAGGADSEGEVCESRGDERKV